MNSPRYIGATPLIDRLLEVFDRRDLALEHICDHVLTRPEAHDWAILMPGYWDVVNPGDDMVLGSWSARLLWEPSPSPVGQTLYELYCDAIQEAVSDAIRLKWYWEEQHPGDQRWCGLGLSGVYVVWDRRVVRTAMLLRNAELVLQGSPRTASGEPAAAP